jgi:hypothetical protein
MKSILIRVELLLNGIGDVMLWVAGSSDGVSINHHIRQENPL